MITIMNVYKYALAYKYIVARFVEGDWWFYGAWNSFYDATQAAKAEGGQVFPIDEVNLQVNPVDW